ncbi:hypothetical protein CRM22_005537 [Opisthorchis felineus]|uniref:Uncharacterized protein n=1 Tax=Opisthorchis felineus TaxID=147828 RepID=A0A4S2LXL6_OPIFE|nr:hypothetical protein CRM22_005537 [Opisthorchis felineus]
MLPTSTVAAAPGPFCAPTFTLSAFNPSNSVATISTPQVAMNLVPAVSYASVPITGSSMPNTIFTPAMLPTQQQQPVIFSGAHGNFFLAQPAAMGGTPVMLASGQPNTPGTFVLAQPLPGPNNPGVPMPAQPPANCIIRLPDGRFVVPAQAAQMGITSTGMSRLPGAQATYFPVSVPPGSGSTSNTPPLHQQQSTGMVTPPPGQAFYIQVPSAASSLGGSVYATSCTTPGTPLQPQSNTLLKPAPQMPCMGSAVAGRHPVLMSSPVPLPTVSGVFPSGATASNALSVANTMSLAKPCTLGGNMASVSCMQPISTAFPGGMTVTRLPNGTYTTVPCTRPQSPMVSTNCTTIPGNGGQSVTPATPTSTRRPTAGGRTNRPGGSASATTVLQQLDEQITAIQKIQNPSEAQTTRLQQLIEVRNQLSRTTKTSVGPSSDASQPALDIAPNCRPLQPAEATISPTLRREILDTLARNSLLPKVNAPMTDTFVVEFRLNQQRYQLRLSRAQKIDMERLLFSVTSQRQAEILTVLQQEQARVISIRGRMTPVTMSSSATVVCTTTSPHITSNSLPQQPIRLQSTIPSFAPVPSIPMHPAAFGNAAGLRLVAARPMLPTPGLSNSMVRGSAVTMTSSTPVMGVVTALAVPPIGAQGSATPIFAPPLGTIPSVSMAHGLPTLPGGSSGPGGLFISSTSVPPGTQTFVMQQQPVMIPTSSTGLPTSNCSVVVSATPQPELSLSESAPLLSHSAQVQSSSPGVAQTTRLNNAVCSKQVQRLSRMRANLVNDLKYSTAKLSDLDAQMAGRAQPLTSIQLLELLAHYHIHQDADNTKEALLKVDKILEESSVVLMGRKRHMIEAVNSQLYLDNTRLLNDTTEDRLLLAQMALDLERDVFEAEKNIFSIANKELSDVNGVPSECKHNNFDSRVSSSSPLADTLDSSVPEQPLPVHRRKLPDPVYLKHSSSALPPPWSTLLGPLAYLRPLEFTPDGSTRFATINLPELPNESLKSASDFCSSLNLERLNGISEHLPTNNTTVIYPSERCLPNSMGDNIDRNEESSDEAEADALLGLDTRQSRTKSTEHLVTTNGLLDGRVGSSLAGPSLDQDESVAFDETYDLWQELMRDEGMDIEEMESETLHACLESNSDSLGLVPSSLQNTLQSLCLVTQPPTMQPTPTSTVATTCTSRLRPVLGTFAGFPCPDRRHHPQSSHF